MNKTIFTAIVRLEAGDEHGTAFFIGNNLLLTARHVVCNAQKNHTIISVHNEYEQLGVCRVKTDFGSKDLDIALLETDYESPFSFELLNLPCDSNLHRGMTIQGFPALLHGSKYTVSVDGIKVGSDGVYFDVLAQINNGHPLENYKGLSGSPVINSSGSVVGVVTIQQFVRLGYTSIEKIQTLIDDELPIQNDWKIEDHTTYGLGRARERVEESIRYIGSRYTSKPNIAQSRLKKELDDYLDFSLISESNEKIETIKKLIEDLSLMDEAISHRLQNMEGEDNLYVSQVVQSLLSKDNDRLPKISDTSYYELRKVNNSNINSCEQEISKFKKPILLHGKAGYGKTHFLCDYAKTRDAQTYLVFGNQFRYDEGYLTQIADLLGFDEGIEGLEEKMKDSDSVALIIIDSINEGVGIRYWNEQLYDISNIVKYPHIRFLLSIRDSEDMPNRENFRTLQINGFENPREAIKRFFEEYEITDEVQLNKMLATYSSVSPLFLKIYCDNLKKGKNTYNKFESYKWYITQRNREVATIIDEDPLLNITWKYLMKIAEISVKALFQNIERNECRKVGDKFAPNRLWSKSLLNAMLTTNLLVGADQGHTIDFEYEEMGDILKAASILYLDEVKKQPEKAIDFIKGLIEKSRSTFVPNYNKFNNGVKQLFNIPEIRNYVAKHLDIILKFHDFIEFGSLDNGEDELALSNLFDKVPFVLGRYIIEAPSILTTEFCSKIHISLIAHSLNVRDKVWGMIINKSYDWANESFIEAINKNSSIDLLNKCKMLIWCAASSYPVVRRHAIWSAVNLLASDITNSLPLLNSFSNCNDDYVLEGMFSTLYGAFLINIDKDIDILCSQLASEIFTSFYSSDDLIPDNLSIRFWSLKLLDLDNYINGKDWFNTIFKNKYLHPDNTFNLNNFNHINIKNDKLFGESKGSQMLWYSLCGFSDFNRYIIGTNYSKDSSVFTNPKDNTKVDLEDIVKAISSKIQELGWTDDLGEIDSNFPNRYDRFENIRERIGKKYQWIAWNKVMGCLMDKYSIKEYFGETTHNLPWYIDKVSRFDPTLYYQNNRDYGISIKDEHNRSIGINFEEWYEDDSIVFNDSLIHHSEDKDEWIILAGYNSLFQQSPTSERYSFFEFDNSAFVKKEHLADMIKWAEDQNFYGRWLPERTGCSDFLWNEYPWADSFKCMISNFDWEDIKNGAPNQIMLSYIAQLQEDTLGLDLPDNWPSSAYAPCPDVMKALNLYTAERGVVREIKTGKIIALHSVYSGMRFSGIIMRKEYLDRYLKESDCALMFFICGEKSFGEGTVEGLSIKELSGAAMYTHDKGLQIIQPIHVVKT